MLRWHENLHLKCHTRSKMSLQRRNRQQTWILTWLYPKVYSFPIGLFLPRDTEIGSSDSWVEVSVSFSNRVRQYSFPPCAPQSGEHRTIGEGSRATLVGTFPSSLNLGFLQAIPKEGQ